MNNLVGDAQERTRLDAAAWREELPSQPLTGVRILLVEDDAASRDALAFVLAAYGARVSSAADYDEACRRFSESGPDVIVSDIGLPGPDGCVFLGWVRAHEASSRRTPAIAISGFPPGETAVRARAAGFDQFLSKPVDPELLVQVVRAALGDCD